MAVLPDKRIVSRLATALASKPAYAKPWAESGRDQKKLSTFLGLFAQQAQRELVEEYELLVTFNNSLKRSSGDQRTVYLNMIRDAINNTHVSSDKIKKNKKRIQQRKSERKEQATIIVQSSSPKQHQHTSVPASARSKQQKTKQEPETKKQPKVKPINQVSNDEEDATYESAEENIVEKEPITDDRAVNDLDSSSDSDKAPQITSTSSTGTSSSSYRRSSTTTTSELLNNTYSIGTAYTVSGISDEEDIVTTHSQKRALSAVHASYWNDFTSQPIALASHIDNREVPDFFHEMFGTRVVFSLGDNVKQRQQNLTVLLNHEEGERTPFELEGPLLIQAPDKRASNSFDVALLGKDALKQSVTVDRTFFVWKRLYRPLDATTQMWKSLTERERATHLACRTLLENLKQEPALQVHLVVTIGSVAAHSRIVDTKANYSMFDRTQPSPAYLMAVTKTEHTARVHVLLIPPSLTAENESDIATQQRYSYTQHSPTSMSYETWKNPLLRARSRILSCHPLHNALLARAAPDLATLTVNERRQQQRSRDTEGRPLSVSVSPDTPRLVLVHSHSTHKGTSQKPGRLDQATRLYVFRREHNRVESSSLSFDLQVRFFRDGKLLHTQKPALPESSEPLSFSKDLMIWVLIIQFTEGETGSRASKRQVATGRPTSVEDAMQAIFKANGETKDLPLLMRDRVVTTKIGISIQGGKKYIQDTTDVQIVPVVRSDHHYSGTVAIDHPAELNLPYNVEETVDSNILQQTGSAFNVYKHSWLGKSNMQDVSGPSHSDEKFFIAGSLASEKVVTPSVGSTIAPKRAQVLNTTGPSAY